MRREITFAITRISNIFVFRWKSIKFHRWYGFTQHRIINEEYIFCFEMIDDFWRINLKNFEKDPTLGVRDMNLTIVWSNRVLSSRDGEREKVGSESLSSRIRALWIWYGRSSWRYVEAIWIDDVDDLCQQDSCCVSWWVRLRWRHVILSSLVLDMRQWKFHWISISS